MLVELIQKGIEAEKRKQQEFFELAEKFRETADPEEKLGTKLGPDGIWRLMPKLARWDKLPENVRHHPIDRMRDRAISIADLNQLRVWIDSQPDVPEDIGTRTSDRSRFAGAARNPRPFCCAIRPPRAKRSDPSWPMCFSWSPQSTECEAGIKASATWKK